MILTCSWCERYFEHEPRSFQVYLNGKAAWLDLCRDCMGFGGPTVPQLIHKLETDPLIYAMEKANDTTQSIK